MKTLAEVFAETFEQSTQQPEDMVYNETDGWDSLGHMRLCSKIEDNFDIMLDITDIPNISSYVVAIKLLNEKYAI